MTTISLAFLSREFLHWYPLSPQQHCEEVLQVVALKLNNKNHTTIKIPDLTNHLFDSKAQTCPKDLGKGLCTQELSGIITKTSIKQILLYASSINPVLLYAFCLAVTGIFYNIQLLLL